MQKDEIITKISSTTLDKSKKNNNIIIENINKTIIYDKEGNILIIINGGYLDIGIHDTMKDLLVNFIGVIIFCFFEYFYLLYEKNKFIINFVPKKGKR